MSKSDLFISKYLPYAEQMQEKTGVPALVALAQSALETGWGSVVPGNMMFGMKAGKSWKGEKQLLQTKEYHSTDKVQYPVVIRIEKLRTGKYKYWIKDYFRKYKSPYYSFLDYARLLTRTRYQKAFQYKDDPIAFAREIAKAGYATDPNYFTMLRSLINKIKKKIEAMKGAEPS